MMDEEAREVEEEEFSIIYDMGEDEPPVTQPVKVDMEMVQVGSLKQFLVCFSFSFTQQNRRFIV